MRSDKISPGSSAGARLFSPQGRNARFCAGKRKEGKKTWGQDSRWGLRGRQAPREHGCVREAIIGNILISAAGLCNSHVTHQWRDITACPTLVFTQSFTNFPVRCTKAVQGTGPLSVVQALWLFSFYYCWRREREPNGGHAFLCMCSCVCVWAVLGIEEQVLCLKDHWLTHQWEKQSSKFTAETKWPWSYCSGS